jgi:NAD-dependent deacetylase
MNGAGARDVVHMHGEITRALCAICEHRWDAPRVMDPGDACPACGAAATRPDIVWFGEMPYHMERIIAALEAADLFVAIGTSGEVYPAAGSSTSRPPRGRKRWKSTWSRRRFPDGSTAC